METVPFDLAADALPVRRAASTTALPGSVAERPAAIGVASWRTVAKRTIDIAGASGLVLLLAPLLLAIAATVRLTSPGPVLYRQLRVGKGGQRFTMLKFRTFPREHEPSSQLITGEAFVVPVTRSPLRVGHLLRQTSLDELPQLLNVLRGDMSLVGPRPERPELVAVLADRVPGYDDRHRVPGGITGHAQVLGLCGTTPIELRVQADNEYIDGWSIRRDLGIIVRTVPTLVRKFRT